MAAKKTKKKDAPNALEFCREYLKKSPTAPFAEIRDAAKKRKLVLYPISYGRAKALEGLVKTSPYGSKSKAKAEEPKRGRGRPKGSKNKPKADAPRRGPGRPKGSKNTVRGGTDLSGLDGLVATLKTLQKERDDAVATLDQIRELLG